MDKIKFFIIFVCGLTIKAQDIIVDSLKYRADYILSYQNDSTDVYSKHEENFILLIGSHKSLFVSENTYKRDSIRNEVVKSNNISSLNLANIPKSAFSYRIIKNTSEKQIIYYDLLFRTAINYKENLNLQWELSPIKEKIENLNCGIAYLNYGGRRYKTWYSTDIAIPEGPYKFFGLLGLIIKMEDSKGYYKFELARFKDMLKVRDLITLENRLYNGTSATKQQYLSAKENYINNLGKELEQSGLTIGNDAIRNAQNRERKKNNPIELKP